MLGCLTTFFVLLTSVANLGQTQNQPAAGSDNEVKGKIACRLGWSMVLVEVEVKDRSGNCVLDLSHNEFLVSEDHKRQTIEFCSGEETSEPGVFPIKYTVGYYSTNYVRDGGFRSIRVKVRDGKNKGLKVSYYPEWYFATPDQ
jgi:hypothetical protein